MSKGYADATGLANYMDLTFTTAQTTVAGLAIGTAETWIDHATRHAWLETGGQVTETVFPSHSFWFRVAKPPVVSFDAVSAVLWPGADPWPLDVASNQYVVRSLRDGLLAIPFLWGLYSLLVKYTPTAGAPPDEVKLATLVLASATLRASPAFMDGIDPTLVQRYSVGGELEVEFRKNLLLSEGAQAQALSYLESWAKNYVVA